MNREFEKRGNSINGRIARHREGETPCTYRQVTTVVAHAPSARGYGTSRRRRVVKKSPWGTPSISQTTMAETRFSPRFRSRVHPPSRESQNTREIGFTEERAAPVRSRRKFCAREFIRRIFRSVLHPHRSLKRIYSNLSPKFENERYISSTDPLSCDKNRRFNPFFFLFCLDSEIQSSREGQLKDSLFGFAESELSIV